MAAVSAFAFASVFAFAMPLPLPLFACLGILLGPAGRMLNAAAGAAAAALATGTCCAMGFAMERCWLCDELVRDCLGPAIVGGCCIKCCMIIGFHTCFSSQDIT